MRKNWTLIGIALLVALLAISAVACSDDDEADEEPTATEVAVADPTEPPDEAEDPTVTDVPLADPTATAIPVADPTTPPDISADPTEDFSGLDDDLLFHTLYDDRGVVTGDNFYTLYIFDNDGPGVSNCTGSCADAWPPYVPTAPGSDGLTANWDGNLSFDGTISTITRDNGDSQVTFYSQPLYFYSGDAEPGDRNGDGVGGVWHIVVIGE